MKPLKSNDVFERDQSGMTQCLAEMLGPDTARGLIKDIYRGERARIVMSRQRQAQIARQTKGDHVGIDQVGALTMEIDDRVYHYWGQRLGYKCWSDPAFLREFKRDNPEVRVKNVMRPNRSGWRMDPVTVKHPRGGIVLTDKRGGIVAA